jgi:hypothetical protein
MQSLTKITHYAAFDWADELFTLFRQRAPKAIANAKCLAAAKPTMRTLGVSPMPCASMATAGNR